MSFSFSFDAPNNVPEALRKVKQLIEQNGGTFSGSESGGDFVGKTALGKVTGRYAVGSGKVTVEITDKPWPVPQGKVKQTITDYFTT